jgi:hypothetical protein
VSDLYIPHDRSAYSAAEEICGPILGIYKSLRHMNVDIGPEAPQFPEKEYINEFFVAVVYYSVLFVVFFTASAWQMSYVFFCW